jgi:hypothetical protein
MSLHLKHERESADLGVDFKAHLVAYHVASDTIVTLRDNDLETIVLTCNNGNRCDTALPSMQCSCC